MVYKTACRGCHGGCLFDMTVENGRVTKARPAKDGPLNHGRGCVKGLSILEQMYHSDRIRYPMRRLGEKESGKWERITWDEAYEIISKRMNSLIQSYGPESISTITGTGRHHLPYVPQLSRAIGTPNHTSAGALICMGPRRTAAQMTSGEFCGVDYYGKTRPEGILVWGANPAVSGADGELQWLIKDAVRDGTSLLVVDPKPTELAQKADIWLRVRPGTDGVLAMGILHVLIENDYYDHAFVEQWTYGFEELREECRRYPPEKVEEITWVPAREVLAAAEWLGQKKPLALEWGCGVEQDHNAMDTCRAIFMIPAITGNYDVPGGFVESMQLMPPISPLPNGISAEKRRIGLTGDAVYTAERMMGHPWNVLEAMRTGRPYKIRGAFILANNTLLSMADSQHTYESLRELEFLVYMDFFMTPTAELADIFLPAALWPEVDCFFSMPEFGDQVVLSQRKLVQVGECKTDEEFILELCRRAGWDFGAEHLDEIQQWQVEELVRRRPELTGLSGEELRRVGFVAPERKYYNYRDRGFKTPTGKFEFYSTEMERKGGHPLPRWTPYPESCEQSPALAEKYPLVLTTGGRQQPFFVSNNRQILSLRMREPFPRVRIHPRTAEKYGIRNGDWVWIENQRGRITQKALLVEGLDERVVNCDFGWWYPEAPAPEHGWRESNANILTNAEPPHDPFMGSYQMRGLLCRIYKNPECTIEQRYERWVREKT